MLVFLHLERKKITRHAAWPWPLCVSTACGSAASTAPCPALGPLPVPLVGHDDYAGVPARKTLCASSCAEATTQHSCPRHLGLGRDGGRTPPTFLSPLCSGPTAAPGALVRGTWFEELQKRSKGRRRGGRRREGGGRERELWGALVERCFILYGRRRAPRSWRGWLAARASCTRRANQQVRASVRARRLCRITTADPRDAPPPRGLCVLALTASCSFAATRPPTRLSPLAPPPGACSAVPGQAVMVCPMSGTSYTAVTGNARFNVPDQPKPLFYHSSYLRPGAFVGAGSYITYG